MTVEPPQQVVCEKEGDRWQVAYTAHVRITLSETVTRSGSPTFREDYGTGDAVDRQLSSAIQMALKASVTDALKRTARHFGDKLGSCLYQSDFDSNKAPQTLEQALELYDREHPYGI